MEVSTDRAGCYVQAGEFLLGSQKATAVQRMGVRRVLMPEHSEDEISLSAYASMSHSHKRVAVSKSARTLWYREGGLKHLDQQLVLQRGFTKPTGSMAAEASGVPT